MNKFPVVYALIPFIEPCGDSWGPYGKHIFQLPYYYVIQKMFLVAINTEYTRKGDVKRYFHVVNPIKEVNGSVPLVFYRPEIVDVSEYEVVDAIYLNIEDAKKAKEEINNSIDKELFYRYDSKFNGGTELYELQEKAYLDMLSDLKLGFNKVDNYKYNEEEKYFIDNDGVRRRVKTGEYSIRI